MGRPEPGRQVPAPRRNDGCCGINANPRIRRSGFEGSSKGLYGPLDELSSSARSAVGARCNQNRKTADIMSYFNKKCRNPRVEIDPETLGSDKADHGKVLWKDGE